VVNAVAAGSRLQGLLVLDAYDFRGVRRLCDVGGGSGAILADVLLTYPGLHGVLYDLPALADVRRKFSRRLHRVTVQGQQSIDELAYVVEENVLAWRSVRLHGAEASQASRFERVSQQLRRLSMKSVVAASTMTPITQLLASCALAAVIVAAIGLPFAHEGAQPGLAALALIVTGLAFATLGVITGIWAETFDQQAFIANIVITPLALLGGVFYAAHTLGGLWSTLTRLDPLYYLVDATRAGLTGTHQSPPWVSLAVTAAVAIATFSLATTLLARGWRLKP